MELQTDAEMVLDIYALAEIVTELCGVATYVQMCFQGHENVSKILVEEERVLTVRKTYLYVATAEHLN